MRCSGASVVDSQPQSPVYINRDMGSEFSAINFSAVCGLPQALHLGCRENGVTAVAYACVKQDMDSKWQSKRVQSRYFGNAYGLVFLRCVRCIKPPGSPTTRPHPDLSVKGSLFKTLSRVKMGHTHAAYHARCYMDHALHYRCCAHYFLRCEVSSGWGRGHGYNL